MTTDTTTRADRLIDAVLSLTGVPLVVVRDPSFRGPEVAHTRRLIAFFTHYHIGLSVRGTAVLLGVSESTVKRLRGEAFRLCQSDVDFYADVCRIQEGGVW